MRLPAATTTPRTWKAWATVGRHIDADTFVADPLDLGWGVRFCPISATKPGRCAIRVLLPGGLDYDAPERGTILGKAATACTRVLAPVGSILTIESFGFDDFGRTLASVTLPDGRDLAGALVAAGHVK